MDCMVVSVQESVEAAFSALHSLVLFFCKEVLEINRELLRF